MYGLRAKTMEVLCKSKNIKRIIEIIMGLDELDLIGNKCNSACHLSVELQDVVHRYRCAESDKSYFTYIVIAMYLLC